MKLSDFNNPNIIEVRDIRSIMVTFYLKWNLFLLNVKQVKLLTHMLI